MACTCYKHFSGAACGANTTCNGQTFTKVKGGYTVHESFDNFVADDKLDQLKSAIAQEKAAILVADSAPRLDLLDTNLSTYDSISS